VDAGTVRKYTIEEGKCACYQYVGDSEYNHCCEHYHLKCSECGKLLHVSCEFMDEINEHIKNEHNFIIDNSKTVFYGICKECANNEQD
jgi:Fur family ferric uptake transcriptional regulator